MPTFSRGRWGAVLIGVPIIGLIVAVVVSLALVVSGRVDAQRSSLTITVLSSRPDVISGASAQIGVSAPPGTRLDQVRVRLNGADVTNQLKVTDVGLTGLIGGLAPSVNRLEATAPDVQSAVTTVTNHPLAGPVISGSQQTPFRCELDRFTTVDGQTLADGPSPCQVAPTSTYVYRAAASSSFKPLRGPALTDPTKRPDDLVSIPGVDGTSRPFIVRVETMTVNRGVAQIAMLDDPAAPDAVDWNGKLAYTFGGGGCGGGARQGDRTAKVLSPNLLRQGFAVASNSLNVTRVNCNDVIAAEAFMMTRELFIKQHGQPVYTLGLGCSGGAAQAYQIADNYPGLLDGLVAGCSLADLGFDLGQLTFDVRLLADYARRHPGALTTDQLLAVTGLDSTRQVATMNRLADLHATRGADASIWAQSSNVYGADEAGRPRRPMSNVGVQYGLSAFQTGRISAEQFVSLNTRIGGLDADLKPTEQRTVADSRAVRTAYATGRLLNGGGGLADIPIIDYRAMTYRPGETSLDLRYHSFVIRQRLVEANGDADNQVLLTDTGRGRFDLEQGVLLDAVAQMDRWILAVQAATTRGHRAVVQSRPADLVDACWDGEGSKIIERQTYGGPGRCNRLYPSTSTPRMVAGGPLAGTVLACVLKPVDRSDYPAVLSASQLTRLEAAFPTGVCDWPRGGDGQRDLDGTWLRF